MSLPTTLLSAEALVGRPLLNNEKNLVYLFGNNKEYKFSYEPLNGGFKCTINLKNHCKSKITTK